MQFAKDLDRWFDPAELSALSNAVDAIDDFILGELADRYMAEVQPTEGQFSTFYLPARYAQSYDFSVVRRLYACLVVVAGRLQDGWEPPRCRGEELVLRAVLEHAEVCLEEMEDRSTTAFPDVRDVLFADLDHEFMFDPRFDGSDDPETEEGAQLMTGPLDPSAWFKPLYDDRPVHPMVG